MKGVALNKPLDLKMVSKVLEGYTIVKKNPLVLSISNGYVMVSSSGAVVLWDLTDRSDPPILHKILEVTEATILDNTSEDIQIEVDDTLTEETFLNEIKLKSIAQDRAFLIMETFAQSLALDRLKIEVAPLIASVNPLIHKVQKTGKIGNSTKNLMKIVGYSMGIKYQMLSLVNLLGKPPETWDSESLGKLYTKLFEYFELGSDSKELDAKVSFVESTAEKFINTLSTRKSHGLEIAVIVLFVIEILKSVFKF